MKDYTQKELESSRPKKDALDCINYCLECLFEDNKHKTGDEISKNLTYEEIIGALLLSRDMFEAEKELFEAEIADWDIEDN